MKKKKKNKKKKKKKKKKLTKANSGSIFGSTPNSKSLLPPLKPAGAAPSSSITIGEVISTSLKICGPGGMVTK